MTLHTWAQMRGEWVVHRQEPLARLRAVSGLLVVLAVVANTQSGSLHFQGPAPLTFTDIWSLITGNLGVIFLFIVGAVAILKNDPFLVPGWVHRAAQAQKDKEYDRMLEQKNQELAMVREDRDGWKDMALDRGQLATEAIADADHATRLARSAPRTKPQTRPSS